MFGLTARSNCVYLYVFSEQPTRQYPGISRGVTQPLSGEDRLRLVPQQEGFVRGEDQEEQHQVVFSNI